MSPVCFLLDEHVPPFIQTQLAMLITNNRASMPGHLNDHLALGRQVPGIVQVPRRMNIGTILDDLWLIWAGRRPDEFRDQIVHLPLRR